MNPKTDSRVFSSFASTVAGLAPKRAAKLFAAAVLLIFLVSVPLFANVYHLHLLILVFVYAYLGMSWNVIGGMTGKLSLGHALYVGTAAYASTFLFASLGISPWIGGIVGGLLAALFGVGVGASCFRYGVKGHFFALATLAVAEIAKLLVLNSDSLGGANGIILPLRGNDPLYFQFESKMAFYYLSLGLVLSAMLIGLKILRSRIGYQMKAVRDDEVAAEACGINSFRVKLFAMALSAGMTGIGGVFLAQYNLYVDPDTLFGIPLSIQIVLVVIVGGIGTVSGPLAGALVLSLISEGSRTLFGQAPGAHLAIYGLLLMIVILIAPKGIVGSFESGIKGISWRDGARRRKPSRLTREGAENC